MNRDSDELMDDDISDYFDDMALCGACGHYYCTCCGCDCLFEDCEEEDEDDK
jgi:hypothetical protein